MFRTKICGITNLADALAAISAGADAVGLNFYPKSSRFVELDAACEIVGSSPRSAIKVGVFVNASTDELQTIRNAVALDAVQLHGDEPPSILRALEGCRVVKAFRLGPDGLMPIRQWLDVATRLGLMPHAVLLDAYRAGEYGGTGTVADWKLAAAYAQTPGMPPLILAGGLTPDNVASAIRVVHPWGVDVAGGVEATPGVKDPEKMNRFVSEASRAFADVFER